MSNDKLAAAALREAIEVLDWYADGKHRVTLSGPIDWPTQRAKLAADGFDFEGEAGNGHEYFVERGTKAEAAAGAARQALAAHEAEKQAGPGASDKEDAELFRWLLIAHDWGICEWDERESQWVRDSRSASVVRDAIRAACNPTAIRALLQRMDEAEAEVQEQARLNGMGAERELAPRARLDEAEMALQWRPIETAPKDGSCFLCWVMAVRYGETDEGQQYQEDVSQADFCHWQSHDDAPNGGWFEPCCGQIGDGQDVTHWLPLPPAPKG